MDIIQIERMETARMGRCLLLVPLRMGAVVMEGFVDEFWHEQFLEEIDISIWPENVNIED